MEIRHTLGRYQIEYGTFWFPKVLAADFLQVVPRGSFDLELNGEIIAENLTADFVNLSIAIGTEKMRTCFKGTEVVLVSSDLDLGRLFLKTIEANSTLAPSVSRPSTLSSPFSGIAARGSLELTRVSPFSDRNSQLVFLDTETTGFSPEYDEVIEIAAIRVNGHLEEIERFQSFLIPYGQVRAVHIHGYTREFLMNNGRPQEEVFGEFMDFVGDSIIAGHNVNYDLRMLEANGLKNNVRLGLRIGYDTLIHARSSLMLSSYKLDSIAQALNLGNGEWNCHNALDDVLVTIELAKHLGVSAGR